MNTERALENSRKPYVAMLSSTSLCILLPLMALASLVGSQLRPQILSRWAPDEASALGLMWQVHATFVSIGFTGLSISFQLLAEPPLAVGTARRAVTRYLKYRSLLVLGLGTDLVIGATAIWLRSDVNVLLMFLSAFLPSVTCIALAYAYSVTLYSHPAQIELLSLRDLVDLVRKACREWAEDDERNRHFVRAFPSSGLIKTKFSGRRNAGDDLVTILYTGQQGVIRDIDVSRLISVARQLEAWLPGPDTDLALSIQARIGMSIDHGRMIGEIRSKNKLSQQQLEQIQAKVNSAITLKQELPPGPSSLLEEELSDLQDKIIEAIKELRYTRAKRGYRHCAEVERTVRKEMAASPTHLRWGLLLPPNQRLIDNLYAEIDYAAGRSEESIVVIAADAAFERSNRALQDDDLPAFRGSLESFLRVWYALNADRDAERAYVLLSLHNLAQYVVASSAKSHRLEIEAGRECIWTMVSMVKSALDAESLARVDTSLKYLTSLYSASGDSEGVLTEEVLFGFIVLIGWVLYCRNVRHTLMSIDLASLLRKAPEGDTITAVSRVTAREEERWRTWEISSDGPVTAGVLVMSDYILQAAILIACKNGGFRPIATINKQTESIASAFLGQIGAIRERWVPALLSEEELGALAATFERVVQRWQEQQAQWLSNAPLDQGRIDKFITVLQTELSADGSAFIDLFGPESPGDAADPTLAGYVRINTLVPKEYFVSTDVWAEPEELASSFARAIRTAETQSAIQSCQRIGRSELACLELVPARVAAIVETMENPIIVVFGSHQVMDALGAQSWAPSSSFGPSNIPVQLIYGEDVPEQLMLFDRDEAPTAVRSPRVGDDLSPVEGTSVSAAILDHNSADSEQQPQVHVRVEERIAWELSAAKAPIFIYVPDVEW
jgi:HAMP domain-containing protein